MNQTAEPPSGVVTIVFTDIVGSTSLRDDLVASLGEIEGDRVFRERILEPHNELIRRLIVAHRGFEVKTNGDSFMVCFSSPSDAVTCAAAIQRRLRDQPIETGEGLLAVRIGMHTGQATPVIRDGMCDYDGHAVNIAARIEGLLKGGNRICCSRATSELAGSLPDLRHHSYGHFTLKGVSSTIEIVEVLWQEGMELCLPEQPMDPLPYPWLTPWIGRESKMAELEVAIRSNRLVTLHGTGGVGKTRLAVETLLARGGGSSQELAFIPLESRRDDPDDLLAALRDAIAVTELDAPDLLSLCRYLKGTDRLLVFDNFETLMSGAGVIAQLATTPGVRIVVTTQRALGISGERVIELDPMPTRGELVSLESYRLFVELARMRDAQWKPHDDAAMSEILIMTDGLPYLIELVAAVAPRRLLGELAHELRERLSAVRARGSAESRTVRHASVQACLEWAVDRLPEREREVLPRLAVFVGDFDADAAQGICGAGLESLDILIDASLLKFNTRCGRYSLLFTVRDFARHRLSAEQRRALGKAHSRVFIEALDIADVDLWAPGGDRQTSARAWIATEWENISHAIDWAEGNDEALFARAVKASTFYLSQTYRFAERLRLNLALVARLNEIDAPREWATAQDDLGCAYAILRTGNRGENLENAIVCFQAALRVWTEHEFPEDWATTQSNLGNAFSELPTGDRGKSLEKAMACYEAALRVRSEREHPLEWALTQNNFGNAYARLPTGDREENLAKAIMCCEGALRVWSEREFPLDWAMAQYNLGRKYAELSGSGRGRNLENAIACYQRALAVWSEREFPLDWARVQRDLGNAYVNLSAGNRGSGLGEAIVCYEAALRVFTERDDPQEWAMTQSYLGVAYVKMRASDRRRNLEKAIACFEAVLRVHDEHQFPMEWAVTQSLLGSVYAFAPTGDRKKDVLKAIAHYEEAERGFAAAGHIEKVESAKRNLVKLGARLSRSD